MPIYRVETQQQGQLKLRRWRHSLRRALGLLAFTILACMAGLILLDPEQHSWQLKAFDALWNAINAVTTVGDFTAFNRGQRAFMLATVFAFVGVGGYAVTTLTGVLASQELKNFRENRTMSRLLEELEGHVVIVGFGAVGRLVAGALKARGQPVVVVDMSPDVAAEASALGYLTV